MKITANYNCMMQRYVLPILLVVTASLTLAEVLPILSVDETDLESLEGGQEYDSTFNEQHNNPQNIIYELFDGAADKEKSKPRKKYTFNPLTSSDVVPKNDHNYDDKGFRKEQWHNYPRQLDRLHKKSFEYAEIENTPNYDVRKYKSDTEPNDVLQMSNDGILDNNDIDDVAGPLLILKIRLAFLNNNMNDIQMQGNKYMNAMDSTDLNKILMNDQDANTYINKVDSMVNSKRDKKGKAVQNDRSPSEITPEERKSVNKRIFSLWSRLQHLSHKGHELQHRRHLYTFYGLPDNGGGTLTAETRASLVRPPGSPLRWG